MTRIPSRPVGGLTPLYRTFVPVLVLVGLGVALSAAQIDTTKRDFHLHGTQPLTQFEDFVGSTNCGGCHGYYDGAIEPYRRWVASMMGQSTRDPIFHACLAIAEQDLPFSGDTCLRCHAPLGWMRGSSEQTDGSLLSGEDFDGVTCNICHRMVDPVFTPGSSPPVDAQILADLGDLPPDPHTANYILDPFDRRRGPFATANCPHPFLGSPFHTRSAMCATCHDISNPALSRQPDGTYRLNDLDTPHPTQSKYDMFPVERTYSEWAASAFAVAPIEMGGRFGGNRTAVSSCQDCHMPDATGRACANGGLQRNDLPLHDFRGANTWVLRAVHSLYPELETRLTDQLVDEAIARNIDMLQRASDLELDVLGANLHVRILNYSGHKLPTGYIEGRRMWINVRFLDAAGQLVAERGAYDHATATLDPVGTKVYEALAGLDEYMAALTNLPVGPSFHFVLNNKVFFDNRIPPMGYANAAFESVQAEPVGYAYADGQYWDDTLFAIPPEAASAAVTVYYQTTSREYIEFLRDENTSNSAGQLAYQVWEQFGRSAPVAMDELAIELPCFGDFNDSGLIDFGDLVVLLTAYGVGPEGDLTGDGITDFDDLFVLLGLYGQSCP